MKKIILLASIVFSLNAFSQIPNYVSTTGLVGWWPFNSNTIDLSSNALNGVATNINYVADRFGSNNSAVNFPINNTTSKIEIGNTVNPNHFSLSVWINCSNFRASGFNEIISKNPALFQNFEIQLSTGTMAMTVPNGTQWTGVAYSGTITLNQWYHVVGTYDGNYAKLFINGVCLDSLQQSNYVSSTSNLTFGDRPTDLNYEHNFEGAMDDIGIWNRALTSCEITQLYNASVFTTPTISSTNSTTLCSGNTTTLSTSAIGSYTWSNGVHTQSITVSAAGSYSVTVTNGACKGNASPILVTVNPSPTITVNNGTICNGQSFTITPSGANTYTYSSGSAIVSPTTNVSYSVTGTSSLGCVSSNTAVTSVSVNPNPTVTSVSNTSLICVGQSATLTANGANMYTWSPGALTSSNIVISPTVTTNYTVVGTNTLTGCTNQTTLTQSVSACTGIENLTQYNNLVNAYPNPTKGLITIELNTNSKVYITNALGQEVYNEVLSAGKHYIDIKNQSNGIYFIKVLQQDKQQTIKLIKE